MHHPQYSGKMGIMENGNHYNGLSRRYIGIMEKKRGTTIVGYVGVLKG